jgi:membrane protein
MEMLKKTFKQFLADDCPRMAAALSYYTVFSLPALLILVMLVAGIFVDPAHLRGQLLTDMERVVGPDAANQVREILRNADRPGGGGGMMVPLSVAALLFAATGAFAQLQETLNRVWSVGPDPERGGVRNFLMKRGLSFVMILGVALLLVVSLLAQTLLSAFGDAVGGLLPDPFSGAALLAINVGASLLVATLLFGILFVVLPDARIPWRYAWIGSAATAVLFLAGNVLLGLYLSRSQPGSPFGAAGSLALILVWIYYSSMIFFLGAELTQVLTRRRGEGIRPSKGAVRVVREKRTMREEGS